MVIIVVRIFAVFCSYVNNNLEVTIIFLCNNFKFAFMRNVPRVWLADESEQQKSPWQMVLYILVFLDLSKKNLHFTQSTQDLFQHWPINETVIGV